MFYGITDLATYTLGAILIVLLPGPNSLFVMSVASRRGIGPGYRGACGIFLGDTVLMILAAGGAASLLRASPTLFALLKYAGAAYLFWVGLGLLRAALGRWQTPLPAARDAQKKEADPPSLAPFRKALLISLMNPKAILFFLSFFIQFVDPDYPHPALSFGILGLIVQLLSALYLSALIFGGALFAQKFKQHHRLSAAATAATGMIFIGFCLKLATANLS